MKYLFSFVNECHILFCIRGLGYKIQKHFAVDIYCVVSFISQI